MQTMNFKFLQKIKQTETQQDKVSTYTQSNYVTTHTRITLFIRNGRPIVRSSQTLVIKTDFKPSWNIPFKVIIAQFNTILSSTGKVLELKCQ